MMQESCGSVAIGVEIGVDRVAAVSLSDEFAVVDTTCLRYEFEQFDDSPGIVDPNSVVDAVFAAVSQLALTSAARGHEVRGLAFGAPTEETVIAVDENETAMVPVISTVDHAWAELAELINAAHGDRIRQSTGIPLDMASPITRIAWFIDADDTLRRARWCGLKDYVAAKFSGRLVGDRSTASSMGLLDQRTMWWSAAALKPLRLHPNQLPLLGSSEQVLPLDENAAHLAGLDPGTPMVLGASGPCLAPLAMGLHRPGAAMAHPDLVGRLCALGHRPDDTVQSTFGLGDRWLLSGDDFEDLRAAGFTPEVLRVAADMRQSPEVAVEIATSLGLPVEISDVCEPLAVGAAALAWHSAGVLPSFDATAEMFKPHRVFHPR